ncbi:unnamed protein product [Urochloa decumbens]|uniref:Uncharacterized protein n=1 Tax=Urochloa decumbens TaxID=240449 RepID=A0ABC9DAH1_9POAL
MALAFAGRAVAASAISAIVRKSFDYLDRYTKLEGMRSVKERLERTLPQVQLIFDAIDMERIRDQSEALDAWLWQLRDAVEESEDVLDEVEYYKLEKKVKSGGNTVSSSLYKCKRLFIQQFSTTFSVGTFKRMADAMKKLDEVAIGVERFLLLVDHLHSSNLKHICRQDVVNPRETSSFMFEDTIFGRDTERDQIVKSLIEQGGDYQNQEICNVTLFALVGIGGMGKTTLAQAVYNDQRVKQFFDCAMWVCVSNDFDVPALTRKIIQEITGRSTDVTCLNTLQKILSGNLSSKKFLLVFDDVWNDERRTDWEKLLAPLKIGQKGSKIILTTRMQSVVDMAERMLGGMAKCMRLEGLQENDLLALFNKHAFFGVNPSNHVNLQEVSKQIIKKLSGSPLAAKVMGGLLNNSMDCTYWNRMLREDICSIECGNEGVLKVLRLSYHHLSPPLQACFRYCSMFREDYRFTKKELVDLWTCSGLIQLSVDEKQTPEDVGEYYLGILSKKSFIEMRSDVLTHQYHDGREIGMSCYEYYVLHDLLHELARTVSMKECIRISSDAYGIIPETVRHAIIIIKNYTVMTDFSALKKLRTLLISFDQTINQRDQWIVLKKVLNAATKLRVFHVHRCSVMKLPDAFDNLLHLRYLSHPYPWMEGEKRCIWFPCSIYKLYHLRILRSTCSLVSWWLGNLVSLRHLENTVSVIGLCPYFGRLTSLQELNLQCVPHRHGLFASEIKNLKDLRYLEACGLENVNAEEAFLTKLSEKETLNMLSLSWQRSQREAGKDEGVLDHLQPHASLGKLKVSGYNGSRPPCWMENPILTNVTYISLSDCQQLQYLPPLGRLASLKYLYLRNMSTVKTINSSVYGCQNPSGFPSLNVLHIDGLPALDEWVEPEDGNLFPQLEVLVIKCCRSLRNVPALPSTLACFELVDVGLTTFPATYWSTEPPKFSPFKLKISHCRNLVTVEQMYCFEGLEKLLVEDCENLMHMPMVRLQKLPAVRTFSLLNCPNLIVPQTEINFPSSIRDLNISQCGVYGSFLLKSLCFVTSLITLKLGNCVMTAPQGDVSLPTSIRHLYIDSCGAYESSLLSSLCSLTSLTALKLYNRVMTTPQTHISLPSSIQILDIGSCGVCETSLLNSFCSLTSLTSLQLYDCLMTALPSAEVFKNLATVQHLQIVKCSKLGTLDGIEELANLRELNINGCDQLDKQHIGTSDLHQAVVVCRPHLPKLEKLRISSPFLLQHRPLRGVKSVTHLTIDNSHRYLPEGWLMQNRNHLNCLAVGNTTQLVFLPSIMASLNSLKTLEILKAVLLQSLPELPASLERLLIIECHPVLVRRCRKRIGCNWHRIARIRDVKIDHRPSGYGLSSYIGYLWRSPLFHWNTFR